MASGHVNRSKRPNTWLHRPACGREESPCQLGAVHTWHSPDGLISVEGCPVVGVKRKRPVAARNDAIDPERSLRLRRSAGPSEREDHLLAAWRQVGSGSESV